MLRKDSPEHSITRPTEPEANTAKLPEIVLDDKSSRVEITRLDGRQPSPPSISVRYPVSHSASGRFASNIIAKGKPLVADENGRLRTARPRSAGRSRPSEEGSDDLDWLPPASPASPDAAGSVSPRPSHSRNSLTPDASRSSSPSLGRHASGNSVSSDGSQRSSRGPSPLSSPNMGRRMPTKSSSEPAIPNLLELPTAFSTYAQWQYTPASNAQLVFRPKVASPGSKALQPELLRACATGDVAGLCVLLDRKGVSINCATEEKNETPFHLAARNGSAAVLRVLLRQPREDIEAVINKRDVDGTTTLHAAVTSSNPQIVDLLLTCPYIDFNAQDAAGFTPLHLAAKQRSHDMLAALFTRGADLSILDDFGHNPVFWMDPANDTNLSTSAWYERILWHYRLRNACPGSAGQRTTRPLGSFDYVGLPRFDSLSGSVRSGDSPDAASFSSDELLSPAISADGHSQSLELGARSPFFVDLLAEMRRRNIDIAPLEEAMEDEYMRFHEPGAVIEDGSQPSLPLEFDTVQVAWLRFLNSAIDSTGSTKVRQTRFRQQAHPLSKFQIQRAKVDFEHADKDRSGFIDRLELGMYMSAVLGWQPSNPVLFQASVNALFMAVDVDHSGLIDIDEFLTLYAAMRVDPSKFARPQTRTTSPNVSRRSVKHIGWSKDAKNMHNRSYLEVHVFPSQSAQAQQQARLVRRTQSAEYARDVQELRQAGHLPEVTRAKTPEPSAN
eukprot:TRINITY_DN26822_c0_g1_i1.p1 TRINITY_DN26822_c0_g1~~TRINITY_DN26822_c0_g1_i1.p1  ORF type:complete len:727 (+),score=158.56 TRINITY_DN26822_c0_g1_i1:124-2304(+)